MPARTGRDHRCHRNQPPELRGPVLGRICRMAEHVAALIDVLRGLPAGPPPAGRPSSRFQSRMEDMPCPTSDLGKARENDRERYRRLTKERLASGLCPKCGRESLPPERRLCHACGEKKRKAERARYARAKVPKAGSTAAGIPRTAEGSGGREAGSASGHTGTPACARDAVAVLPSRAVQPDQTCRDARQAAEREQYAARRAEGMCGRCGRPSFEGASRCGPCATIEARRQSTEERGQPKALRPKAGEVALHRLRPTIAGSGAVRAVRAPVLGAVGPITGAFRSFRRGTP